MVTDYKKVDATYGSNAISERDALGEGITRLTEDMEDDIDVYQASVMGRSEAYTISFTMFFPVGEVPNLDQAETVDVV